MRTLATTVRAWLSAGLDVAVAVVVAVEGSAPRSLGTLMAVASDGRVAGNVSAGCVEGAVVVEARQVLSGLPPRTSRFGISDEQAVSVGLTCGGAVTILVSKLQPADQAALDQVLRSVAQDEPVALAVVTAGAGRLGAMLAVTPELTAGSLGSPDVNAAAGRDARALLDHGETASRRYALRSDAAADEVLIRPLAPTARMLIFGAVDLAASLAQLGAFLGYRVVVCDARAVFATRERFPGVGEVVVEWPHRYLERCAVDATTVICVLTHDEKFDVPLLKQALQTPACYIGVMGSRRTQEARRARLREEGVAEGELARLRAPIGLDLGARTTAETAVSIVAEIVALRLGGSGAPLAQITGAIHRAGVA